jgi:predicted alpha/beta hydrolase family esterase
MKKQVVVIHGGDTFESQDAYLNFLKNFEINFERYTTKKDDWKPWLRQRLGEEFEVVLPQMPNKSNAQYAEWKLWFEKLFPFLNEDVILVGHSLGGAFLAKYLSENVFPKKIKGVFLVSAVFDKDTEGYTLASFTLPPKLDLQTSNIFLYHSEDDPVVPVSAVENFHLAFPSSKSTIFQDRKHINQEQFEELAEDILSLG